MKYLKNIIVVLILLLAGTGCNDDFLDLAPQDELSQATAFAKYDNVKVGAWYT